MEPGPQATIPTQAKQNNYYNAAKKASGPSCPRETLNCWEWFSIIRMCSGGKVTKKMQIEIWQMEEKLGHFL